jgi:arsenate reductase-like glutaredoxin family protein
MMDDVNLIRRPIVLRGERVVFGYQPEELERVIGK